MAKPVDHVRTTSQIDKQLHRVKAYRGCYCKDELGRFPKRTPGFYVLNLENSVDSEGKETEGSHWVALMITRPGMSRPSCYCDSYGLPPPDVVLAFADAAAWPLHYSKAVIQGVSSESCGEFATYVVKQLGLGRTVNSIMNHDFSANAAENGRLVSKAWLKA